MCTTWRVVTFMESVMLPTFLPPEKTAAAKDVSEFRSFLETDFAVQYRTGALSDVNLLAGGEIEFRGEFLPTTQSLLESAAAFIGMPLPYAYDIDFGLFQHNFEQRKHSENCAVKLAVVAGRCVGMAKGDYEPARTIDVIDALSSVIDGIWNVQKGSLSDGYVELDLVSKDFVLEPAVGDEIRVGIRISNSETGGCGLKAALFTHRLVCSNGAVMKDAIGTVRWAYDNRMVYNTSIAKFANGVLALQPRQQRLVDIYRAAVDNPMPEEDLIRAWRRVRSAANLSIEETDRALELSAEERHRISANVAERRAAGLGPRPSSWDTLTIHNRITAAAKSFSLRRRSRLERIGGDMLPIAALN